MNKRFVWNFEIQHSPPLLFEHLEQGEKEELRWEARFFWHENEIIILHGLPEDFLELTNYEVKARHDSYLIFPHRDYNIKQRRGEFIYKPLLKEVDGLKGYGKKTPLLESSILDSLEFQSLPRDNILPWMKKESIQVNMQKDVFIKKLACHPTIKLEICRLKWNERIFFTAAIEGRSHHLVKAIAAHVFPKSRPSDFIQFIKQNLLP